MNNIAHALPIDRAKLKRFAVLSIGAALLTMGLKALAYWLTGSVGLLSDALESLVNLGAAIMGFFMLTIAARPADETHVYGYSKAEYFSGSMEGALIIIASASIIWISVPRLFAPPPLQQLGVGLIVSTLAASVNAVVAWILLRAGRRHQSITLEADAQHLFADVWTSVGVVVGIGAVALTDWVYLDPIIALAVAAHILWTGVHLLRRSARGLMDAALPAEEQDLIKRILDEYVPQGIQHHALLTRQAGSRRFISVHVLVDGKWTVRRGHDLLEEIEAKIRAALPGIHVVTHLEPLEDPAAWNDLELDRDRPPQ